MLTVHKITKSYNIQPILADVTFNINPSERIGLIGPNGSGKTTLLRIMAGLEPPDSGVVTRTTPELRLGYLAQGFEVGPGLSIEKYLSKSIGDPEGIELEVELLAFALVAEPDRIDLHDAYANALSRLESLPIPRYQPDEILKQLGLDEIPKTRSVDELSGGQKTRLSLAAILLTESNLLLLDEPTNHLDIPALEWLESWLSSFKGSALIVSHDRTFLDNTVEKILSLDPETHGVIEYQGNYSAYLELYLDQREKHAAAYRDQLDEIRRMRQDITRTKGQASRVEQTTTSRQPGVRRYAKKVARKALSREKKLERYLHGEDRVEKPKQSWQMDLQFENPDHQSQVLLSIEEVSIGYSKENPLLENISGTIRGGKRIVLTGPNGSGKTTLLKTIIGEIEPLKGMVRHSENMKLGYLPQDQGTLSIHESPLQIIQAHAPISETDARTFLHKFLFSGDEALKPASQLSHGERARLILASLVVQGYNLLVLDEPINHLDIPSRSRFEQALSEFSGTILVVLHDRYFIRRFATEVWILENGRVNVNY